MGHYATGDCGFRVRTFAEFAYLAAPRVLGGVGVGQNGLELRWEMYDEDEDVLDTIFLTDLPAPLRARFDAYPQRDDDIVLPMPCRLGDLANLVAADMRKVAPELKKATKGCAEVHIAHTPSYRLLASEIDEALEVIREELPAKLRSKLSREALAQEKAKNRCSDYPDTPLVGELLRELRSNAGSFLLNMVTWMLWHVDRPRRKKEPSMIVSDDSCLYEVTLRQKIRLDFLEPNHSKKECADAVDAWEASLLELEEGADPACLRNGRLEVLVWSVGLPIRSARVSNALAASAHAWGLLGRHDRAIAELDWALVLRKTADLFNWRGYHRHLAGNLEGAIADYTAALARKRDPTFLTNRAEAHLDAGRPSECIEDARAALEIDPEDATAKELLAKANSI
jgi:tetratricopeptide (TPR) repeat protein